MIYLILADVLTSDAFAEPVGWYNKTLRIGYMGNGEFCFSSTRTVEGLWKATVPDLFPWVTQKY